METLGEEEKKGSKKTKCPGSFILVLCIRVGCTVSKNRSFEINIRSKNILTLPLTLIPGSLRTSKMEKNCRIWFSIVFRTKPRRCLIVIQKICFYSLYNPLYWAGHCICFFPSKHWLSLSFSVHCFSPTSGVPRKLIFMVTHILTQQGICKTRKYK